MNSLCPLEYWSRGLESCLRHAYLKLKLKLIYDRQSVGQSVLVLGDHLGPVTNSFFLLEISFRQLRVCLLFCSTLSDDRTGLQFTVKLLLGLARAVTLRSKSRRTDRHILLSHLRLPQPGESGSRIYIPQEQGGPVIPPCGRLLRLAELRWRYSNPPPPCISVYI
jgi:hypothetical protein